MMKNFELNKQKTDLEIEKKWWEHLEAQGADEYL